MIDRKHGWVDTVVVLGTAWLREGLSTEENQVLSHRVVTFYIMLHAWVLHRFHKMICLYRRIAYRFLLSCNVDQPPVGFGPSAKRSPKTMI